MKVRDRHRDNPRLSRLGQLGLICVLLAFAGCNPARDNLAVFDNIYQGGQLRQAKAFCEQKLHEPIKPKGDNLLWALQLGAVERAQRNYSQSNLWFDRCEEMMKTFDMQMRQTDVIGTTIVNDNVLPYRGQAYDGIMVNTYKALNFMSMGNDECARVELNRVMERQTRAKEKFSEEINREKDRLEKAADKKDLDYEKTTDSPDVRNRIAQVYPDLYGFEAYPDFVNPFSTYLGGVYFMVTGDIGKARDLLRESAGMLPDNDYVRGDYTMAEKLLDGRQLTPTVWVFFENGLGPVKDEYRVDLPLFFVSSDIYYTGIALPKLVKRQAACGQLTVYSQGKSYSTELVGDMDRVIQTEFAKEYPWILARALLAAGVKTAAQHYLTKDCHDESVKTLAKILTAAYTAATTAADVRIWSALPKDFQVASLPMPGDGQITIMTPGNRAYPVTIESCRAAIVYVKMVSSFTEPTIEVMKY